MHDSSHEQDAGGGRHKDKKSKVEKKQVLRQEPLKSEGPAIWESDKDAVIQMLEENEYYRKIVDDVSGGSDTEVKRKMQHWETTLWAVEARKGRTARATAAGRTRAAQSKRGKQVRFAEEQQLEKTRAANAGEPEVIGIAIEVRTGSGSAGLVRGEDERCRADETNRKGKGKGNGGKGET